MNNTVFVDISYKWANHNCIFVKVILEEEYKFLFFFKYYKVVKIREYASISYALEQLEKLTKGYDIVNVLIDKRINK